MRARAQDGWSMIEVVITILVIALVAAYAIPKLLGPRDTANDGTAKTSVRTAITAAETEFAQKQTYAGLTATRLHDLEPSITASDADPETSPIDATADPKKIVTLDTADDTHVVLCAASKTSKVFCAKLLPDKPTQYYTVSPTGATPAAKWTAVWIAADDDTAPNTTGW